ncbi:diacylglycerol kinase [Leucobacter sp. CSA1]|uniref:Diacylglycerol kinase n=1 Tax=Leucobacter chromiisoli TaxID=2796471 RepID=A0A934UWG6_9MICO|nr:diacylglycerol kinase family protein [Leucobacter chromiisoli]MBK0419897.1 diacylglycerol kinase [Leucobacter chromiisoli]
MSEKIGIVWNPSKAERGKLSAAFEEALAEAAGIAADANGEPELLWFETTLEDPGQEAAQRALDAGCGVVVAVGGDGTVRAVAERLGRADGTADLGIVPLGTGNLLARNLGVPLGDPQAAFARAMADEGIPLDLGEVRVTLADGEEQHHAFVVMVGFGIDAQMIAETDAGLKDRAGWLAYVESLGRAASGTQRVRFSLALDDAEAREEEAHTLLVANCGTIQGGITLLPDANPSDGELDLLVLRADGVGAWLETMRNMMWDNGLKRLISKAKVAESTDSTTHLRARSVSVSLPVPLAFEIDGEQIGETTGFEASIRAGALRVR